MNDAWIKNMQKYNDSNTCSITNTSNTDKQVTIIISLLKNNDGDHNIHNNYSNNANNSIVNGTLCCEMMEVLTQIISVIMLRP